MTLLSARELASMRATMAASLPDTCVIQRKTLTADGQGGRSEAWAAAGTVACRIAPLQVRGQAEVAAAGRVLETGDFIATLPNGTDVRAVDRLVSGGVTYEVVKVKGPRSWELSRRCQVVVVD